VGVKICGCECQRQRRCGRRCGLRSPGVVADTARGAIPAPACHSDA
jgi:hypothetical protein